MAEDPGDPASEESLNDDDRHVRAQRVFARLFLVPYTIHFKDPAYMRDATMNMLDRHVCKELLRLTTQHKRTRLIIGTDPDFWPELLMLFRAAIPSLERRSFSVWDPTQVDYESTSSLLIAINYPTLWADLDRLTDVVSIARNVVTHSTLAQDYAAESFIEDEIFRLINCCVRVTARGYDGDAGTGDEEKWQWIVSAYKKLLIVLLQFMNNLVAQNERRKLMLWVSLFDSFPYADQPNHHDNSEGRSDSSLVMPEPPVSTGDILVALGETSQPKVDAAADALRAKRLLAPRGQPRPSRPVSGYVLFVKEHTAEVKRELGHPAAPTELAMELSQRWAKVSDEKRRDYSLRYDKLMLQYDRDLEQYNEARKTKAAEKSQIDQVAIRIATIEAQLNQSMRKDVPHVAPLDLPLVTDPNVQQVPLSLEKQGISSGDYNMHISAEEGARILENGKTELLKRLHDSEPEPLNIDHLPAANSLSPVRKLDPTEAASVSAGHTSEPERPLESDEEPGGAESEVEESEDEEYGSSNEDGRGLLTDVPLILGPSEIEVLPMIIMSGIVPPAKLPIDNQQDYDAVVNMHTVRCHLLLAQDNGKNLLRELLIFVAAWDLRDEELYFKFMLQIMEAILVNGLMPYAYHAFRDRSSSKDIISPAQAVIMKLLTNSFRSRAESARLKQGTPEASRYPARVDVHIVNFIFSEFRQHIIPQTCALIFLQGKIHQGAASPEEFPLNLWDMERMYEGVYQYLEFFAVLTEEQTWKDVMAEWEVSSELVTMLRELEVAIPKSNETAGPAPPSPQQGTAPAGHAEHELAHAPTPMARGSPQSSSPPPSSGRTTSESALPATVFPVEGGREGETPLAYPEDPHDEPSDFEWRNLKKLTVLVLSSLIWKNKKVQDQVRRYGGLEALVGCCKHDEHNPYIREHAIMCLRFAVEGNAENAEVIRRMAGPGLQQQAQRPEQVAVPRDPPSSSRPQADGAAGIPLSTPREVPKEVLDTQCYETFMDKQGQVGLRRKQALSAAAAAAAADRAPGPGCASPPEGSDKAMLSMQAAAVQAVQGAMSDLKAAGASSAGMRKLTTKLAAERAAEIMQTALRDLPLPAVLDKENKDIIARLNRTALELSDEWNGFVGETSENRCDSS